MSPRMTTSDLPSPANQDAGNTLLTSLPTGETDNASAPTSGATSARKYRVISRKKDAANISRQRVSSSSNKSSKPSSKTIARKKPIRRRSKSRQAIIGRYMELRQEFLEQHPLCAVYPNRRSTDIHHIRGRAGNLMLDTRFWLAVSRQGHNRIHTEPEWARRHGFLAQQGQWGKQNP